MNRLLATFALGAALYCTAAGANNVFVKVGGSAGLVFVPQTVTVNVGDTVTFVNNGGVHNVVADDGSFRCAQGCDGAGGNGNATGLSWRSIVKMTHAGKIGYFCEVHGMPGVGMFGTINVQGAAPAVPPEPVPMLARDLLPALVAAFALAALGAVRARRGR